MLHVGKYLIVGLVFYAIFWSAIYFWGDYKLFSSSISLRQFILLFLAVMFFLSLCLGVVWLIAKAFDPDDIGKVALGWLLILLGFLATGFVLDVLGWLPTIN